MAKMSNVLRQRTDDTIYRCVTVDDTKSWNKFSYRVYENDKEISREQFINMWDAINYFDAQVDEYMKPWREIAMAKNK